MVFYLVGLGLGDPLDVTVRGLEVIKSCDRVYLEAYTSILSGGREALEKFYGRKVIVADREQVEQGSDELFVGAKSKDVALLVVGDPLGATTHTDLKLRAHQLGIPVEIISNASILNAVGSCGLQLYHFGETVSIPFWQDGWEPVSFCEKINKNLRKKLHTLCLLDIKVKEQSLENLLRGRKIFEPPRYMRVAQAVQQLLAVVERHHNASKGGEEGWLLTEDSLCVGLARVGTPSQQIVKGKLKELVDCDLGEPLHSLIVCGECHPVEEEAVEKLAAYFQGHQDNLKQSLSSHGGVFHMIGLGLGQPGDVTVKGLHAIKKSKKVFLESYTSVMDGGVQAMMTLYDKEITVVDREMVEQHPEEMLQCTRDGDVAFLVVGDPLSATTHIDLVIRVLNKHIPLNVIHNASILNAVGCCGLQLYSFGETVSLPFWEDGWCPDSYYDKICSNMENGWHTLCLLDIKVKEQKTENLVRGLKVYEAARFMTATEGAAQILEVINRRSSEGRPTPVIPEQLVIGVARVGTMTQMLKTCALEDLACADLGAPLHCLVIVGETHPLEDEYVNMFR
ncbi:Diphthine methyl ester synthase [Chionoecetes opilio]|uniref:diphthine methyl ester synthase n=1 Tax=Chionoecetes opilio TaxID=41210 RepID=A0A8J4YL36_CHIOP|nr:Diphthine methyl ester synthase [Chionoecetes opilio]